MFSSLQLRMSARVLAISIALTCLPLAARAEDFYEQQLRLGKADVVAGRQVQAADELRVAAFGFLDKPSLLSEALVRLALVQSALGRSAAVTQTLNHFMELERRFATYGSASLEPETRARFETILLANVPPNDIRIIPGLARLIRGDAERVSNLPAEKRAAAYEQGFRRAPRDIDWPLAAAQDAASRGMDQDVITWSRRALGIDNSSRPARLLLTHALARRGNCREALTEMAALVPADFDAAPDAAADQLVCLVAEKRYAEAQVASSRLQPSVRARIDVAKAVNSLASAQQPPSVPATPVQRDLPTATKPPTATAAPPATLPRQTAVTPTSADILAKSKIFIRNSRFADAQKILEPAVAADPSNRELRLALLEAAFLARSWRTAVAQVERLGRFNGGEEVSMFYAASALYEVGRKDEARVLMQRARPRLPAVPIVQYYSRLILGPS